ncbi:hypothetical protein LTS18_011279 [Coniosporium uncinatum]|uniref:Uncharacterized protein n=1 Tax=Coniosporium uncinatum TaxID=93489 RepID=A0ACC3DA15_9PEZI|nr:hypothetical protein LTS18_011279 [Coniosporium uncinatum]
MRLHYLLTTFLFVANVPATLTPDTVVDPNMLASLDPSKADNSWLVETASADLPPPPPPPPPSPPEQSPEQLLAAGLKLDVLAEQAGIAAIAMMQAMQAANINSPQLWNATHDNLMTMISTAIRVRGNNQAIAPRENAALPGLAELMQHQVAEYILANNLTGDPLKDGNALESLKSSFMAGISLNQALAAKVGNTVIVYSPAKLNHIAF